MCNVRYRSTKLPLYGIPRSCDRFPGPLPFKGLHRGPGQRERESDWIINEGTGTGISVSVGPGPCGGIRRSTGFFHVLFFTTTKVIGLFWHKNTTNSLSQRRAILELLIRFICILGHMKAFENWYSNIYTYPYRRRTRWGRFGAAAFVREETFAILRQNVCYFSSTRA